jgi:hypothetical protein
VQATHAHCEPWQEQGQRHEQGDEARSQGTVDEGRDDLHDVTARVNHQYSARLAHPEKVAYLLTQLLTASDMATSACFADTAALDA